ncbi:MAG: hemolysin family protein [Methanomassiliicoccaceae archaeon]|nr:hemolysin family protein [Methanomassiliicoccaceae archaeon]
MMDPSLIVIVALMGVLVLFSAYFSCSETSYTGMSPIKIKNQAYEGNKNAEKALRIHDDYDRLLTTVLVGNNLTNVALSTIGTMVFTELLGVARGVVVATVFMVTVILIFGEIIPKTLAKRNAERYALRLAGSMQVVMTVLAPITWVFLRLANFLSRNAKNDAAEAPSFTEEELYVMIDEVSEEGALERSEGELVKSAMQFDDIKVSEMYTPRSNMTAADMGMGVEDLKALFLESEYSRIPVYEGSVDRIIGSVNSKDFFARYFTDDDFTIDDIIRPVKFVPENTSIAALLTDLQRSHIHIAIVLDNFGRTLGLVSMEDILEELVGDIWDESDEAGYPVHEEKDGTYTVPGEANIFDVMKNIGAEFDAGDFPDHSVSQYITHMTDGVPRRGDTVDAGGARITVRSMKSRRVKEARISPVRKDPRPPGTQGS